MNAAVESKPNASGWRVIWEDRFAGAKDDPPSPARWRVNIGRQWAGGIENNAGDPAHLGLTGDGRLHLTATADGEGRYAAPWIETLRDDFVPPSGGALRIATRVKTAGGPGLDCALWAWGSVMRHADEPDPVKRWYRGGEIDVFEVLGSQPDTVFGVVHSPACHQLPSLGMGTSTSTPDGAALSADYHTYEIVWTRDPDSMTWYLDGREYLRLTPSDTTPEGWLFNQPVFLCFAIIIGSPGGPILPGDPDPARFPTSMLVESIVVAERGPSERG
jgi:hypothetical protein